MNEVVDIHSGWIHDAIRAGKQFRLSRTNSVSEDSGSRVYTCSEAACRLEALFDTETMLQAEEA